MSNVLDSNQLALFGGVPLIQNRLPRYNTIGKEEISAVTSVLESGVLSQFIGCWDSDFYGGPWIQKLESKWSDYFGVKHSVSVNSNTSGLITALGAVGIEPGDEVIVSPWSMCASATSILVWNAIPVFADIEEETFNLDPNAVVKNITARTKAIVVPDIFGHPAALDEIMAIAKKHKLVVIEDVAQAPGALYREKYAGTIADIGVFSLNYHKHIHSGEGGICVTDNAEYCERMQLIRNHAEAVVEGKKVKNLSNMIGFNFRMTEIEAAIAYHQLDKLRALINEKQTQAQRLTEGLRGLFGLRTPIVKDDCTHVYYKYPLLCFPEQLGVSRDVLVKALKAEGVSAIGERYVNIHRLPMYQNMMAYGSNGFPWRSEFYNGTVSYAKGICPVAERFHDEQYFDISICLYSYTNNDIDLVIKAFHKVWSNLEYLRSMFK